ncbi:MAG: hypothetical protein AAB698_00465 [Patescibacteria group bacterium]
MKFPYIPFIIFLLILATIIFIWYQNQKKQEKPAGNTGNTTEEVGKKEEKKGFGWGWAVIILLVIGVGYVVLKPSSPPSSSTPARVAEHKKIPLEEEFPKVVAVGTEWKRIKLPYCSWFDVSPVDNKETVKVRLLDGREFNLFPDGSLFYRGKKVDDFGKIPGVDIDIKATETSAKVMISVGKKL